MNEQPERSLDLEKVENLGKEQCSLSNQELRSARRNRRCRGRDVMESRKAILCSRRMNGRYLISLEIIFHYYVYISPEEPQY